jgi:hypothetical protein
MLGAERKLYFPSIVYLKDSQLIYAQDAGRPVKLYRLDWNRQEDTIRQKHENWNKTQFPDIHSPFIPFPKKYDNMIKEFIFCLNHSYLSEIRRCSRMALTEYNIDKNDMDTMIREFCLLPTKAFIKTAFKLLADSIFVEKDRNFSHNYTQKIIAFHAMLYKFWCYQTGRGVVCNNAGIFQLVQAKQQSGKTNKDIEDFLEVIRKHQQQLEASYSEIHNQSCEGPDKT